MVCEGFHAEPAPDREGNIRNAIVFELRHLNALVAEPDVSEDAHNGQDLDALRQRALASAAVPKDGTSSTRNVYQRSRDIRRYVLARAKGRCEGCSADAPFQRPDGTPYLDPHHLRRVSDGGPDHPAHVIALCPNCHRRVHVGADGPIYNDQLIGQMKSIELSS